MGIKGVGMATLAIIAKEAGFIVGGSDVEQEFITDKVLKDRGIDVLVGFKKENVESFVAGIGSKEVLFIATGAHEGFDNPEALFAKEKGIKVISHGEAVGLFMTGDLFSKKSEGISVSGAHGKTTIGAMLAFCMVKLGLDPTYTVGTSEIKGIGPAGHFGTGKYFIAEADEYVSEKKYDPTPKFLYQKPQFLIINNIDFDHPDFYADIDAVTAAFEKLVSNLSEDATIIINGDDDNLKKFKTQDARLKNITYGTDLSNEFKIKNFKQNGLSSRFGVTRGEMDLGEFELSIPGYHNAKNSLAVIAFLMEIGVAVHDVKRVLNEFTGSSRRFERIGVTADGVEIFDDYAHHPEEIRKTLEAARTAFPAKKITVIFQAHTFERTRSMLPAFASAFSGAYEVIILPTFSSMRDAGHQNLVEDQDFVEKIRLIHSNVKLIETPDLVVKYVNQNINSENNIIFTVGAGDVYKIGEKLIINNK